MRIARFWIWTCLALALASNSLAQTAAPSPQAPPSAAPAPSVEPVSPAPAPSSAVPLAADPYGGDPAPAAAPADPYGAPAAAPAAQQAPALAPDPYAQPAPAVAPAPAPAPVAQPSSQPAPAPAPQPVAPPSYDQPEASEPDADKCVLGTFCFGPVLTLGVFNPLGIGVHGRIAKHFGFAIDYQLLPTIGYEDISAGISLFTMSGRWHVAGSGFFLAVGFSYQSFWAEGTFQSPLSRDSAKLDASLELPQLMFGLGVLGSDGFVLGIDLALGVPLGDRQVEFAGEPPSGDGQLETMYNNGKESIETIAETFVGLLPMTFQLNLLRIGYIF